MPEETDYAKERKDELDAIINSGHGKRVVVAGPGTGKSYLLQKAIEKKREEGKTKFLAITFIGKLGDALADDLAGIANTTTMHGFARDFVLKNRPRGWMYYPKIKEIIKKDLELKGITEFEIGDANYQERTNYYKAIGDADVVYYAIQICREDESKIPERDLILIDEFQDFNEVEDEFIRLLADKNDVLIVGDDDQALYKFKKSDPKYIREKHDPANTEFESHTLRWCSRCPEVVVKAFHDIVGHYRTDLTGRIDKDYLCYFPDKQKDSVANPKVCVIKAQVGQIALRIKNELESMLESQKVKTVLIIGEGRTCKTTLAMVARLMKEYGFKNVHFPSDDEKPFSMKTHVVDAYKALTQYNNPTLGWRLLTAELESDVQDALIRDYFDNSAGFITALPSDFKSQHETGANTFKNVLSKTNSGRRQMADSTIEKLKTNVVRYQKSEREIFIDQLIHDNRYLDRPLGNIDITVCNILGSKGLGADVVFLIGFDQGKLPTRATVDDSEIYQMLVALTRTKKRIYLVNTMGCGMSTFLNAINEDNYQSPS